jgi:hypothetical protein
MQSKSSKYSNPLPFMIPVLLKEHFVGRSPWSAFRNLYSAGTSRHHWLCLARKNACGFIFDVASVSGRVPCSFVIVR